MRTIPETKRNKLITAATAAEAIAIAGLDFEVKQSPVKYDALGEIQEHKGALVNFRSDNGAYLGTVTKSYQIIQNSDAFKFFDGIIESHEASYIGAGALDGGKRIWLQAELPPHIVVGKDDMIQNTILMYTTHTGKGGMVACVTPNRIACANQIGVTIATARNKMVIRHTGDALSNLKQAAELMGLSNLYNKELSIILNKMASTKITDKAVDKFLLDLYPRKEENNTTTQGDKIRLGIREALETGEGQNLITTKGTVFGMLNAVTYYTDHVKEYKADDIRQKSLWFGGSATIRQKAFDQALVLIK